MSDGSSTAELEQARDPGLETRVVAVEADMKDVKGSLQRLELSAVRIETILGTLATKAELVAVTGKLDRMESALGTLATKADVVAVVGKLDTLDARVSGLDRRLGLVETATSDMRRDQKTDFDWLISVGGGAALGPLVLMARSFRWIGG